MNNYRNRGYHQDSNKDQIQGLTGRQLLQLSTISFFVYLSLAWILFWFFRDTSLASAFGHGFSISYQLVTGILAGSVAAGVIIFFSSRPPVSEVLEDFSIVRIISNTRFSSFDRIQLSIFAGVGEEILFRGAIQPLAGIWLTSIFFIAIHGYFSFKSAGHVLFGLLLFSLSMMLGFLYEFAGLISAMGAHAVYDILMLYWIKGSGRKQYQ